MIGEAPYHVRNASERGKQEQPFGAQNASRACHKTDPVHLDPDVLQAL